MKSFFIRTLSSFVFVVLMLMATLWHPIAFAGVFGLILVVMEYEYWKITLGNRFRLEKLLIAGASLYAFAIVFLHQYGYPVTKGMLLLFPLFPVVFFIRQLYRSDEKTIESYPFLLLPMVYIALPFCLFHLFWSIGPDGYSGIRLLSILILLWASDVGAYIFGTLFGQKNGHKLFPSVSPKKSWEGFFGGVAVALAAAYLLHYLQFFTFSMPHCLVLGLLVASFGTWGDLVESQIKRKFGVKDSGKIMPGHGGMLDRFDGALLAIPVVAAYLACFGLI